MNKYSPEQIYRFLSAVDSSFKVPLSKKQNLLSLAQKFCEKATVCTVVQSDEIAAMVAGYTENLPEKKAYISVVATLPSCRGKGYASSCLKQFLEECKAKNIDAVHLYTDTENRAAIAMYKKHGFVDFIIEDEPRPQDLHLICYFNQEK